MDQEMISPLGYGTEVNAMTSCQAEKIYCAPEFLESRDVLQIRSPSSNSSGRYVMKSWDFMCSRHHLAFTFA